MRRRKLTNEKSIGQFIHCGLCLEELPGGTSPREFAELEVGFTEPGLQVWCKRHECNVMHIDFEGRKHPANITIPVSKKAERRRRWDPKSTRKNY